MQSYVYHMVPREMVGQELMPLNRLGGAMYPDLYEAMRKNILIIQRDRSF